MFFSFPDEVYLGLAESVCAIQSVYEYMFARSLICDRLTEDWRYFPCRSHNNTGFLDRFVPLPFTRSKKLEGNRKKFQSRQSLNILRLRSGSIERNPGPVQNRIVKACTNSGELKTFKLILM